MPNADRRSVVNSVSQETEAGMWLNSHTQPGTVVMARLVRVTYHHAQRPVVWFPPTGSAQMLMEGIGRNYLDLVLVVKRQTNYYRPPDEESFSALRLAFPDDFALFYEGHNFRIFEL
jgi:hypothetical protein